MLSGAAIQGLAILNGASNETAEALRDQHNAGHNMTRWVEHMTTNKVPDLQMRCPQCGRTFAGCVGPLCDSCRRKNIEDRAKIDKLIEEGHTEHCAKRQVWGDGMCECR